MLCQNRGMGRSVRLASSMIGPGKMDAYEAGAARWNCRETGCLAHSLFFFTVAGPNLLRVLGWSMYQYSTNPFHRISVWEDFSEIDRTVDRDADQLRRILQVLLKLRKQITNKI